MQKYDEILNFISVVFDNTNRIAKALNDGNFDLEDLEEISNLYEEREKNILHLKSLLETDIGKEFVAEKQDEWNEKINLLVKMDSVNLELLRKKTKETGEKLKQLNKQKSVLIYSK
ncbi:MAG TPA: hypothetical protein PLU67_06245 [Candidatus Kapabacteria bacterium]|jgi:hypothetical protein|nr:hypothetical protein [Candidatus Kapabacteria bacterium]HOM05080.1 hypothetical protein [Candidatus Kapabacteria bacterium]HOQ49985.1 hypothetical protein [Candidatus Kapabacteria bacterium]HPP39816.1 hypothetical protein [Candidatus Kapabacteria bacterium]HPU23880.1 hypothetical protein [Candidatus Kapabacteria bacterium]